MRIAVAEFSHETCTFCPEPTTIAQLDPYARRGADVLDKVRGIPTYINGFMRAAEAAGDVELVPLISVGMAPGPYTSWMETQCFDKYAGEICDGLRAAAATAGGKPVDGVLLALHGAMAVTGVPKPEAELVRRVRAVVGAAVPIMVTLDLHANEDHELTDASDAVFILKTYPHVDSQEIGELAARCMVQTVRGEMRPVQAMRKPGIMSASIYQASEYPPMKFIYDRCREWEARPGVYCVSVAPGYAYADVVDVGMCVVAVTDGDAALAAAAAQDVSELAWSIKEQFSRPLPKAPEGVAEVMRLVAAGERPVVVADGTDRTGDSTWVLRELLAQGAENFAISGIADPVAARQLERERAVGHYVNDVRIGGWASEHSGEPVEVSGVIEYIGRPVYKLVGPMGKGSEVREGLVVRINAGRNKQVIVSERMRWANDRAGFDAVGVDVESLDIVVLKDRVHHRAFWDSIAKVDFPMDAPGIGPADLTTLRYENAPAGIYPIGKRWR
jgi:microcystin degradation protein MlrC